MVRLTPREQAQADYLDSRVGHEFDNYFDRDGESISFGTWAMLFQRRTYQRVQESQVGAIRISTVWLGMNQRWLSGGTPLIFETMIFGGSIDLETWRYATEEEAVIGHEKALNIARLATQVDAIGDPT